MKKSRHANALPVDALKNASVDQAAKRSEKLKEHAALERQLLAALEKPAHAAKEENANAGTIANATKANAKTALTERLVS